MKTFTYICSCGRTKGEANRWLLGARAVHSWPDTDTPGSTLHAPMIALRPWDGLLADAPNVSHFCSEQCAYKWLASDLERMGR